MITELEQSFEFFEFKNDNDFISSILKSWELSLKSTKKTILTREPILSLRRVILSIHDFGDEINKNLLNFANLARTEGYLDIASSTLLKVKKSSSPEFKIEQAKILYKKGQISQAISIIEEPECDDNMLKAKMLLMAVDWTEQISLKQPKELLKNYEDVTKVQQWEKGFLSFGKYLDYLYTTELKNKLNGYDPDSGNIVGVDDVITDKNKGEEKYNEKIREILKTIDTYVNDILKLYGFSLNYDSKNIYQVLPRMLTIWFNTGLLTIIY
jgi:hypothetical protein